MFDGQHKVREKELVWSLKELVSIEEQLEKQNGTFQTEFLKVLDGMNLERRVYDSGGVVGNDVNKLTEPPII